MQLKSWIKELLGVLMAKLIFKKVGRSVMASFPPAALDFLNVKAGGSVEFFIENNQLVLLPNRSGRFTSRRYSLDQMVEEQKLVQEGLEKDPEWLIEDPCGKEIL